MLRGKGKEGERGKGGKREREWITLYPPLSFYLRMKEKKICNFLTPPLTSKAFLSLESDSHAPSRVPEVSLGEVSVVERSALRHSSLLSPGPLFVCPEHWKGALEPLSGSRPLSCCHTPQPRVLTWAGLGFSAEQGWIWRLRGTSSSRCPSSIESSSSSRGDGALAPSMAEDRGSADRQDPGT